MATDHPALVFDRAFLPRVGVPEPVADGIVRVTAPNASDYTFTGTNSFVLGGDRVFLVDPGPKDTRHLDALSRVIGKREVAAILLTHTHKDHSALAKTAAKHFGAPLWFAGPHRRSRALKTFETDPLSQACDWELMPKRVLKDHDVLELDGLRVEVVTTPGHCANHAAFAVLDTDYLLSGDHVMGWNSTLVAVPDGSMRQYLASLDKLAALPFSTYLPAHGGPVANGPEQARALAYHRNRRNAQIVDLVASGPKTLQDLLEAIYRGVPGTVPLRRAADASGACRISHRDAASAPAHAASRACGDRAGLISGRCHVFILGLG